MAVKRIVANIAAVEVARAKAFYGDILGLKIVMDQVGSSRLPLPARWLQLSVASEGGAGTPVLADPPSRWTIWTRC